MSDSRLLPTGSSPLEVAAAKACGTGMIYGMYVISRVSETGSIFFADGTPRKIDFTLSLTRVDESLAALYGDIGKQAESLIGKAGSMATKFTGMTGAG